MAAIASAERLYQQHERQLEAYLDLLLEWNESINLVSRKVSRETVRQHIIHSLIPAVAGLLDKRSVWVDAGTGGGLPGIPLAIVLQDKKWILNDNIRKKMKAVGAISEALGLENVTIEAKSISLIKLPEDAGIVSKHAFKIPALLRLLKGKPWGEIVMWKGTESAAEEISRVGRKIESALFVFDTEDPFYEGKAIVTLRRV